MSKTSKRAIITILVIATLLTVMIPIMPASAADPTLIDNGIAAIALSEDHALSGEVSVEIAMTGAVDAADYGIIMFETDMLFEDVDEVVLNYYLEDQSGSYGPHITFYLTNTTDIAEVTYYASATYTDSAWTAMTFDENTDDFFGYGPAGTYTGVTVNAMGMFTLDLWQASEFGSWTVDRIGVEYGWWGSGTGDAIWIDDITIDGILYHFEQATSEFTIDYVSAYTIDYGDTLIVVGSGVTAGSEVIVYWDYATGTLIHPLNNTEGNPDGTFDLEVKVPSDVVGDHWLWVKDVATGATIKSDTLTMIPLIKLSPSSGLENDDVTIKGYGFADESDIEITFVASGLSDDGGVDAAETDDLGYFEYRFEVDTDVDADYTVTAEDADANEASATFKLGAAITIDPDEGPTGIIVTVEGRGWTPSNFITFREEGTLDAIGVVDGDVITVGSNGQFSAEIVIPELGNEGDYDIEAVESDTADTSSDAFELTGLPEIVVTPTYGTPGSIITVKGYNFTQIADTEVTIKLDGEDLVIAETNSDGTFEDTFISPAVAFTTYDVTATDYYDLVATDPFKVGLIALIINPVYGEAGTSLSITGIGFANGDYNVTFGTILYEEYGSGVSDEAISDTFYVPNVLTGIYDITITDEDDNEMTVEFRVTAVTEVTLDPAMAPNDYNVSIEGINFADYEDTVDFVLYNATDEWDMDVWQNPAGNEPVETGDDGNFTAYWFVLDEDTLSLGDYTINATGYDDFLIQIPFSVVEARVSVAPRKALFDRGDTIQFNVNNDFDFPDSYMKIWDPADNLYWETATFVDWVKSGDVYTVPYYMQTSGGNPMELSQDAPLGTWFYVFYETGTTQLTNGTFEVGPSAESLLTEQITALSEELGIDIDTLRTVIDDLGIDMDDLSIDINEAISSMADDLAAAVAAADAAASAVADVGDTASDALDAANDAKSAADAAKAAADSGLQAANDAKTTAQTAADAANDAADAAEGAKTAASGLTTLVYGAIGASLIAALAAIVSLMQISRRIAG